MLRLVKECDLFRKLPPEHREAEAAESAPQVLLRLVSFLLIAALAVSETWSFLTPARKQTFDLDMASTYHAGEPRKMRVMLDVTIHDFPCIDVSLDYQDVMGTRAVDVRDTVFKQRLSKNGTEIGRAKKNDPKPMQKQGSANPSISGNNTGNSTCGTCYGALPDGECCNTCSDVLYAYRIKRWALPRIESIEQCKHDGTAKSAYQPPQIIRLDDYSADDFLPKFSKLGSMGTSGSEARITTPFRLNFSFEPLRPLNFSALGGRPGRAFETLRLNFSKGSTFDDLYDYEDDDDDDMWFPAKKDQKEKAKSWPDCVKRNVIVHGYDIGEALMVDLTPFGAKAGCWKNNCTHTDKYECTGYASCAKMCNEVEACKWWTWGPEDGINKCWIRTGRHGREKRYGFSAGAKSCAPNATNATSGDGDEGEPVKPRRLAGLPLDDLDFGRPFTMNFGPSLHMPVFGMDSRESEMRREQRGESCRIHGYFDTNKVPGNFHIGTHGSMAPSYLSFWDEPAPPTQNMRHTINSLGFIEVSHGALLNKTQPLDGFESPKAFTFQYYVTISPATVLGQDGSAADGYQFRAGSFVTNELIGPAVFFRMDIDPIRATYSMEGQRWSKFMVNLCAVVGGCIALTSMLSQLLETGVAVVTDKE